MDKNSLELKQIDDNQKLLVKQVSQISEVLGKITAKLDLNEPLTPVAGDPSAKENNHTDVAHGDNGCVPPFHHDIPHIDYAFLDVFDQKVRMREVMLKKRDELIMEVKRLDEKIKEMDVALHKESPYIPPKK